MSLAKRKVWDGVSEPPTRIEPSAYTEEYFRTAVEGHEEFAASGGRRVSPRMERALELAGLSQGQRLLDIGCGRGEVVRHSALKGANALGIDYAPAAMAVARQSSNGATPDRQPLSRMDGTCMGLRSESFDVALMLDFVEHVYQPELERAFAEVQRVLKPGGRLVVHTSPNRLFEDVVYRYYVRNIHRALLNTTRLLGLNGRFFNPLTLPTDATPPHNEYERELHVNPQSAESLRTALEQTGFAIERVDHWEPPKGPFFPRELRWHNIGVGVLDAVRFLRPASRFPPLSQFFSNHIWVVAERR